MNIQLRNRNALATAHLSGSGIEIGACHLPLASHHLNVRYLDNMTRDELINGVDYITEEQKRSIVHTDIIDDGESLSRSELHDESLDFIIANHFIQYCADPIKTILNHLTKLKIGGALYYAIPDKNNTFDKSRNNTTVLHLIDEYEGRTDPYDLTHYHDWVFHVDTITFQEDITNKAILLKSVRSGIHFHVWEAHTFIEFLSVVQALSGEFVVERFFPNNGNEFIVVIRKISRF
ncbi:hypothetical protein SAMN02745119_01959 [Trichlorobacter thiogenes]|uniref:Methyltransferase domain-containing protein n=1 Tax=Trichlorobacter thiogenes TaxID=115783 RepID=A0A1T4PGF4_9BACT|nr:hypothetical protein [Trichlorobacter thiogenes]SJZ89858.1 hypothetical protein SAMN02745119_01959 [Trichlorobacter thiogenes]